MKAGTPYLRTFIFTQVMCLFVVVGLSYWSIKSLLMTGYFPMHDDTQVGRVVAMGRALREGQFPVRWVSDLGYGYGYPIFNFYGPLPYYVGGSLYALGLDGLTSTKIMFLLGILFSSITMYALGYYLYGYIGGIVASALLTYAPYHAVQIYVRGAVGEYWTMIFLPMILLGIYVIKDKKYTLGTLIGTIGIAGVILSHTIFGYVTTIFYACWLVFEVVWNRKILEQKKIMIVSLLYTLLFGLGFSAFFWLPALSEMQYTSVSSQIGTTALWKDHFICVSQLWYSAWGFGGSAPGCQDGMSFELGKVYVFFIIFSIGLFVVYKAIHTKAVRTLELGLSLALISLFFSLPMSRNVWMTLPFFEYIQYPWRFLTYTVVGISLIGPSVLMLFQPLMRLAIGILIVVVVIAIYGKWFVPQYTYNRNNMEFESTNELRYRVSRISDEYLPREIVRPKHIDEIAYNAITENAARSVIPYVETNTYARYRIELDHEQKIYINRAFFPGWKYQIDNIDIAYPILERGLPTHTFSAGVHEVTMRFVNTPVRLVANVLSVVSCMGFIFYYGKQTNA